MKKEGGGFSAAIFVALMCVSITGLGFASLGWHHPDIRSLLLSKLPTASGYSFPGETALPPSDSRIAKNSRKSEPFQKNFCGFTSPIFLAFGCVCGVVFLAFGVVSLLYLWWTVNMNGTTNMNLVLGLSFATAAGFVFVGQWVLFSVLGLMP